MTERNSFSLPPKLLGALVFTLLALQVGAQTQTIVLDLFRNGGEEAIFFVPVGSGEPFELLLATNQQTDQLVTGNVAGIEVELNGGYDDQELETIEIDEEAAAVTVSIVGQLYSMC